MLDGYKNSQPIAYQILKNAIINDKCSHAYLIETGGFYDTFNFVMSFVKSLLCPKTKLTKDNCGNCHQCEVIDSGNFPEIEIIEPDGLWIKKEQLQNLQKEFNTKALIGNKRIYIIKQADILGDGHIGAFYYDGEVFCKIFRKTKTEAFLESVNKKYPPIHLAENVSFKIYGEVIAVLNSVNH